MEALKLSLLQSELVWENPAQNLKLFEKKMDDCEDSGLILLPEMFTSGFTMNPEKVSQFMDGPAIKFLKTSASQKKSWVGGSLVISEEKKYFNRFVLAGPLGELYCYDKRHLFRMADEQRFYEAGEKKVIVDLWGWKVLLQICYDLRFPVFSRNTENEKYDLVVYIANWPERRSAHWRALLPARAIENQSYVAGLNRVGVDGKEISYSGDSAVFNPLGEAISNSISGEGIIKASLDYEKLMEYRDKFPVWKDADSFLLNP